jgi:fermentation-respiration switch protein FrsA (DUF1100 family)
MFGMMKTFLWIVGIYIAYGALLFVLQRQMLFPRGAAVTLDRPPVAEETLERVWFTVGGDRVEAWFIPPENAAGPAPVAMLAHGNAEAIDTMAIEFMPLRRLGVGMLLVEYPGYGRSGGSPSQAAIRTVMLAARDLFEKRPDVDARRWVYIGRSLGGGVICDLSRHRPPAAMVLMSTFTSVRSFARRYLMPGFLVRDPFDSLDALSSYNGPLLIIHGRHDEIIPYGHGRRLHEAVPGSRMISYDCGHNDCPPDETRFWSDIAAFLTASGIIDGGSVNQDGRGAGQL